MRLRRRFLLLAAALGLVVTASLVGAATAPPATALAFGSFAIAATFGGGIALVMAWLAGPPPAACGACGADRDATRPFCPACGAGADA